MAKTSRRRRNRALAWAAAGSVALVVALVIVAAVVILRHHDTAPSAVPPGVLPSGPTSSKPRHPRPASQDASCPDVQMVSIPGTWESSPQDDPFNPTFNPRALLLTVTGPISQQFQGSR